MKIISIVLCLVSACAQVDNPPLTSDTEQEVVCGWDAQCFPYGATFVPGTGAAGLTTHRNTGANFSCNLMCQDAGFIGGFCPTFDIGRTYDACSSVCVSLGEAYGSDPWGFCMSDCINSKQRACQAGEEPVVPGQDDWVTRAACQ